MTASWASPRVPVVRYGVAMDGVCAVVLGGSDGQLRFHSPAVGPPPSVTVVITVTLPELNASKLIEARSSWGAGPDLADYFSDLARDWRGWDGAREWMSSCGELRIASHHDRVGHVVVAVRLGRVPPIEWPIAGWSVSASVVVEPGQLDGIAAAAVALLGHRPD